MLIWPITFTAIILSFLLIKRTKTRFESFSLFQFNFNPKIISPKFTFLILGLINIIILIGTSWFWKYYRKYDKFNEEAPIWLRFGLNQFNLATENVMAVWYSSMLMLFVSLSCFVCFILEKRNAINKRSKSFCYGWLILSVLFLGLSADEMGSWHESFLMIDFSHFLSVGWMNTLTIPIAIVGLLMALFFWMHVRSKPVAFILMIVGLLLYLSNPFLERIELSLAEEGRTQIDSLLWLEEGGELFGTLCFLVATILYTHKLRGSTIQTPLQSLIFPVVALGGAVVFGMWLFNIYPHYLPKGDVGIAQNWFPAALWMISFLIALNFILKKKPQPAVYFSIILFALANSMYYGANIPGWINYLEHYKSMAYTFFMVLAAIAIILLVKEANSYKYFGVCALWLIFYTFSLKFSHNYAQTIDAFSAYSFLVILLLLYRVPKVAD